jgi:hypothetical protein
MLGTRKTHTSFPWTGLFCGSVSSMSLLFQYAVYLPKICGLDHDAVERASKRWRIWVTGAGQTVTATTGISSSHAGRGTKGKLVYCCSEPTPQRNAISYLSNLLVSTIALRGMYESILSHFFCSQVPLNRC